MSCSPEHLVKLFAKKGTVARVDEHDQVIIVTNPIFIWIGKRPWYCDRGRWQVNAESRDSTRMTIDGADMFPRYYFTDTALVTEVTAWLDCRLTNMANKHEPQ